MTETCRVGRYQRDTTSLGVRIRQRRVLTQLADGAYAQRVQRLVNRLRTRTGVCVPHICAPHRRLVGHGIESKGMRKACPWGMAWMEG